MGFPVLPSIIRWLLKLTFRTPYLHGLQSFCRCAFPCECLFAGSFNKLRCSKELREIWCGLLLTVSGSDDVIISAYERKLTILLNATVLRWSFHLGHILTHYSCWINAKLVDAIMQPKNLPSKLQQTKNWNLISVGLLCILCIAVTLKMYCVVLQSPVWHHPFRPK